MKKEHLITWIGCGLIWQLLAMAVHNDILIPYPYETLRYLLHAIENPVFYQAIGLTVLRTAAGFFVSLCLAFLLATMSSVFPRFGRFFEPVNVILRTIPNVSYIILALIWLGAEGSVTAVSFMILFPIFYNAFHNALFEQDQSIMDAEKLYEDTLWMRIRWRILPQLHLEIIRTGKTAASMGLKVGVMAEILGQVQTGIGRSINYCRLSLDTAGVIAWTLVVILLSLLINAAFSFLEKRQMRKEEHS